MNLIIFDIDGTLLDTSPVDDDCFLRAVEQVFGIADITTDWSQYEHCTDVAIASQLVREQLGRPCTSIDLDGMRNTFVKFLKESHAQDASLFREISGAGALLALLKGHGSALSLATGGFQKSARLKLELAGLDCDGIPAAFSEDGPSREEIVEMAFSRAAAHYNAAGFDRVICVGDGMWDVRTAANLGVPFVGIATGQRADRLRAVGADMILADFADLDRVLDAFDRASVPQPTPASQR